MTTPQAQSDPDDALYALWKKVNDQLAMDGSSTPPPEVAKRDPEFLAIGECWRQKLSDMPPFLSGLLGQNPYSRYVEAVMREAGHA